jgi:H+-transporting ATPase
MAPKMDARNGDRGDGLPGGLATASPLGMTSEEARRRLQQFGPNAVADEAPPRWRVFLAKFWSPIPWLLEAAIALQLALGEYTEAAVIAGLLVFNATLGFLQEGRATAALAALKQRLAPTALVRRDGEWVRLPAADLVPGDVVRLPLGALVPADATILSGSVMVDQSMLTGESVPVDAEKGSRVHAGSLVRRGQAVAEVTATGSNTYFGRTADLVRVARSSSTEQTAILGVTRNLLVVNGTIGVLIVIYAKLMAEPPGDLVRLGLTALLASIPVALPATFTLSAALGAQILARRGVLLTRLSAAHEAAAMDVLCADKTGTLTRNMLEVVEVAAMPGIDRERVLALAVLASSEADQDTIDDAIRRAAASSAGRSTAERLVRFVPFDPATKMSEALCADSEGKTLRIVKGAFEAVAKEASVPADARQRVNGLADQGHRIIAVAMGTPEALRLAGLIALSDPPRADSAGLITELRDMGVRTVMVTGDSAVTAAVIARKVGITGPVHPPSPFPDEVRGDEFGVFARVVPEEKFRLVKGLQQAGHVVGMCGDGTNDAPALKQAQIGIAVSSATDVAKAAACVVLTEPGLAGIIFAIRQGRIAFQRLLTYALNMLVKKFEIVLFLAIGLVMTGQAVMTPVLMVLMLVTNDLLAMSLTTDRASPMELPGRWKMRGITATALALGTCKLAFSAAVLAFGAYWLGLDAKQLQTLAFVTLIFGAQAMMYVVRERRRIWSSKPGWWVLAASAADIAIVSTLALSGTFMEPLSWHLILGIFGAAAGLAFVLDQIKRPLIGAFERA